MTADLTTMPRFNDTPGPISPLPPSSPPPSTLVHVKKQRNRCGFIMDDMNESKRDSMWILTPVTEERLSPHSSPARDGCRHWKSSIDTHGFQHIQGTDRVLWELKGLLQRKGEEYKNSCHLAGHNIHYRLRRHGGVRVLLVQKEACPGYDARNGDCRILSSRPRNDATLCWFWILSSSSSTTRSNVPSPGPLPSSLFPESPRLPRSTASSSWTDSGGILHSSTTKSRGAAHRPSPNTPSPATVSGIPPVLYRIPPAFEKHPALSRESRRTFGKHGVSCNSEWAKYLVGFVVCAVVGVLFFIVMPITGLVFCCCRCCGKCGARPKPQDPKHARCKRNTYCTLLLILNTVALAGVVCTFLSNQILYDKLRNLNDVGPTGKLMEAADQVNTFTNDTLNEVEVAVVGRFVTASDRIIARVVDTPNRAVTQVLESINANALLEQSKTTGRDVTKMQTELLNVAEQLEILTTSEASLSANLSQIRTDLDVLDNLKAEANRVAQAANLTEYINQTEETIADAKTKAFESVQATISQANESVTDMEEKVKNEVNSFKSDIQGKVSSNLNKFRSDLTKAQDDITKYSKYAWYGGLGVGCALLLVVVLYYIAILFGLCGERPGFGAQCCNTGAGANFLMAGVGITFLLSWLIMLVCTVLFVVGGPLYTEVCRYFDHQPSSLQPFSDAVMNAAGLQDGLFEGTSVKLDLVDILEGCERNEPVYHVLKLDSFFNITEITDTMGVDNSLDGLKNANINIQDITFLSSEMNQSLSEFADSGLDSISFDAYDEQLNKNLTVGNLTDLAATLRNISSSSGIPQNKTDAFNNAADRLVMLQDTLITTMEAAEASLRQSLDALKSQSGIKSSTDALLEGLQAAQRNFSISKDELVKTAVVSLVTDVLKDVDGTVDAILKSVDNDIGKCRPVYDGFYSAADGACVVALEPLNGLWFSIGWSLFFFIPCLIFAVKLASLYRREIEERDFDDPNFSLYQEGKQDNIPLTSRQQSGRGSSVDQGMANNGYQESNMGPHDYPQYKGGAVNHAYQHDGYTRPSPPPYAGSPSRHDPMNGNPKGRMYPY
ncbi:prominin-1-A-like [Babylonia areolata]|uniref:prominin-1-A-like n=1 Tax=Babylonia areolata TaxID=304850 RepID=UPI003FD0C84F